MNNKAQNRVAIITGVSKGIGFHCAKQLLEKEFEVYGIGRTTPNFSHPHFHFVKGDVRHSSKIQEIISEIIGKETRIDVLINNAGLGYFGYCEDLEEKHWEEMFQTNVYGVYYCTRSVLPKMKEQQKGHIINIASIAGLEGYQQVTGYCATKFAVRGFSDALYKEVRDYGIKVTCVYPGSVKTDFFKNNPAIEPHDYMLMPEDVSEMIVFAILSPSNFHPVNLEIRPLQPKGPKKK